MKKWITVEQFGDLYKEMILVMFDVPVLFVCKDEYNNRWLVLCEDEETGEYLLAKCQKEELLRMINRISSVDDVIRNAKEINYLYYDFKKKFFLIKRIAREEITEEMLPDKGTYLKVNNNILEYEKRLLEEGFCVRVKNTRKLAGNNVVKSIEAHAETVLRPYINSEDFTSISNLSFNKYYKDMKNFNYEIGFKFLKSGEKECRAGVN